MKGGAQPHSTVGSIYPPSNHENIVEQIIEEQGASDKMSNWLAQLIVKDNKPHKAMEKFQKMNTPVFKGESDPIQAKKMVSPN